MFHRERRQPSSISIIRMLLRGAREVGLTGMIISLSRWIKLLEIKTQDGLQVVDNSQMSVKTVDSVIIRLAPGALNRIRADVATILTLEAMHQPRSNRVITR